MSEIARATGNLDAEADAAAAAGNLSLALRLLERAAEEDVTSAPLWIKIASLKRAAGDGVGALAAIERALALSPFDFSALLSRALLLERLGRPGVGEAFARALAQAPPEPRIPAAMAKAVQHARRCAAEHQAKVEQRLKATLAGDLGEDESARLERFISNTSRRTRHFHQSPTDFHYPALPEIEVHERGLFPELEALENMTNVIEQEFHAVVGAEAAVLVPYIQYPEHVPIGDWRELNNSREWTAIHLLQNGERVEANARHCPATMQALAKLPQPKIRGASPNAMFSLLAPRTRIPPHTGVANVRLVCHLPLIIPPNCGFRVGATTREWQRGKAFVFDDTIEHEAWNNSDELRVVMIFDLWPPALSSRERLAVANVISAAGVSFGGA